MKTLALVLCLFASTSLLAQASAGTGALSADPVVIQFTGHPTRALQQGMADHQDIMESSTPTMERGSRPLWEVAPRPVAAVPLGDIARMLKKEKLTVRKATKVWEN